MDLMQYITMFNGFELFYFLLLFAASCHVVTSLNSHALLIP